MENPQAPPWFLRELHVIDPDLTVSWSEHHEGFFIEKVRGTEHTILCLVAPDGLHRLLLNEIGFASRRRADPVRQVIAEKRRKGEMAAYKRKLAFRERLQEQSTREAEVLGGRKQHALGAVGAPAAPIVGERYESIIPPDARG